MITAKQYIALLQKIVDTHGNLPLCYSSDEEGNSFSELQIGPEAGVYEADEFYTTDPVTDELLVPTHICIK